MTRGLRRYRIWVSVVTVVLVLGLSGAALMAGHSGNPTATEPSFHLTTGFLKLCDGLIADECDGEPTNTNIRGNLFTFTHPSTPSRARVSMWSANNSATPGKRGQLKGSFAIDVVLPECGPGVDGPCSVVGEISGEVFVTFEAKSRFVPHVTDEPDHYNFEGPIRITGGTGFYDGVVGSGTIGGTFHDHAWGAGPNQSTWLDFVVIGRADFPG